MTASDGWTVGYVPAVATLEDRLAGTVGSPARTVVRHVSGWRIDYTEGARLADVIAPDGSASGSVQVAEWDWTPPEGGPSRAASTPTTDDLAAALAEYVRETAPALGLPGLSS